MFDCLPPLDKFMSVDNLLNNGPLLVIGKNLNALLHSDTTKHDFLFFMKQKL